jgi:hypothetical protein
MIVDRWAGGPGLRMLNAEGTWVPRVAHPMFFRTRPVHTCRGALPFASFQRRVGELALKTTKSSNRLLWIVSAALVPIAIAAVLFLSNDAAHGYHETLPAYTFAGVAVICIVVWSYLASNIR